MTASTSPILDETKNVICSVLFVTLPETTFVTLVANKKNRGSDHRELRGMAKFSRIIGWQFNLLKSLLHNVGVVIVSLAFAYLGTIGDSFLRLPRFSSPFLTACGFCSFLLGFLLRVWGAVHFYAHKMRVISLEPHGSLVTSGPYRYSKILCIPAETCFAFSGPPFYWDRPQQ